MAYSILASLPPIYGLYTSFYATLIYMLFGTGMHLSFGPIAFASLMIARVIAKLDGIYIPPANLTNSSNFSIMHNSQYLSDDPVQAKVIIAVAITFFAGLVQFAMCILQLGFLTTYFAKP